MVFGGTPIIHRFAVTTSIFDQAGNIVSRPQKLFRLSGEAHDYAKAQRELHTRTGVISLIEVTRIEDNQVMAEYKSKKLQSEQRKAKGRKR